jgi:hypothetical protein
MLWGKKHKIIKTHCQPCMQCILVMAALGRQRRDSSEFKASLGYIARPCLKKKKKTLSDRVGVVLGVSIPFHPLQPGALQGDKSDTLPTTTTTMSSTAPGSQSVFNK